MRFSWRVARLALLAAFSAFATVVAAADGYPTRPVRMIVPFAAGGSTDVIARVLARKMGEIIGQPVVVENKTGADGRIGTKAVAMAAPDGYTILQVSNFHSIGPNVFVKMPYDTVKDFAGIALTSFSPNVLVVRNSLPATNVAELVKLAKVKPGALNCGMSGLVQSPRINLELLKSMAGVDIAVVPFKGGAEAVNALLGGHIDMGFTSIVEALPHVKAGRLRALGITSAERSPLLPEVPTMVELGYPGYVNVTWQGILAPAGTPAPILAKLNAAIEQSIKMPDVQERLAGLGMQAAPPNTPEEFDRYVASEIVRLGKIIRNAGIQPERE